ncbi:GNAT domain-containing protein [Aspergillus venezuelensis]
MRLNTTTALSTPRTLLVPYSAWHVPRYHEWMKDEEIQQATASEPLSIEEEYAMQRSWREDADKLTFIVCRPVSDTKEWSVLRLKDEHDAPENMIGDINLFLRVEEDDEDEKAQPQIIGEIELMIAEKKDQGKGFGKSALLTFLRYILEREGEVLGEYVSGDAEAKRVFSASSTTEERLKFSALSVKIGQVNERSLKLFEGLGFKRIGDSPNYFGEWELRVQGSDLTSYLAMVKGKVEGYTEVNYERTQ